MIELTLDDPRWASFVRASPEATAFHHPSWATLLGRCYRYRSFALATGDASGRVTAGLPLLEVAIPFRGRKWVSLPFTDACPPLGGADVDWDGFVSQLDSVARARGVGRVEIRADLPAGAAAPATAGVVHRLRLETDADAVFARFKRSQVQRNVRRAEKEGVSVERSQRRSDLVEVFYPLHVRTRGRQGVPVQPRRYFEYLWDEMIQPGLGYVSVARAGGAPVAAAVFLRWNGTVIYKYGASDAGSWPLRPNHLLFWDAVRAGCRDGDHTFDFGRTELENEGLRSFKSGWDAEETPLRYSVVGAPGQGASSLQSLAALVRPALRRAPPWSCRALGALLYRYTA